MTPETARNIETQLTRRGFLPVAFRITRKGQHATARGPGGLLVVLDRSRIVPEDPGADTPAMVYAPFGRGSSTLWCAADVGTLDGRDGELELTDAQSVWLQEVTGPASGFLWPEGVTP